MIFQDFWTWLSARLASYISVHAAQLAAAIEPAAVTAAVVYVMLWGYMHLRGQVDEPVTTAAVRILRIIVVFGVGLRLWLYHDVIVATFFDGPTQLAASLVGASDPISTIDAIWDRGGSVAGALWDRGGLLSGDVGFYIAGAVVYLLVGFVTLYTMFLLALARVALAVLLAVGPLFIVLALFDVTRRYFEAWIHELSNYALVTVLTVMVAALLLDLVEAYASQTAARGSAIVTVDALNLALASGLVILVLKQVLPIAARLAGGLALSGFGIVERSAGRLGRLATNATGLGATVVVDAAGTSDPSVHGTWRPQGRTVPGAPS
ncbi:MAG: type IV secretion system protein [Proteobacteria bacterium]|nr:type IV secretion system protein [Pseudomonadota bacterium]